MRIDGWRVDGFGSLKDYEVDSLEPGVTVVYGENEAGKSTLLGFLRAILFGFPDRRTSERQYPPLRGGRHGGQVLLRDARDVKWTLERHADDRRSITLRSQDGREADESELRRLLGGVDAALFKSVFAFSLTELQDFATLDEEGVRDRIFSAGISGAGKSARDVMKRLEQRADSLLKQGRGQAEINNLVRDINEVDQQLAEAERLAAGYAALQAEEEAFDVQARELSKRTGPLQSRISCLGAFVELRPQWIDLEGLRSELTMLPDVADEALPDRVVGLMASLTQQCTREERVLQLQTDEATARGAREQQLARLGPGWDVDRMRVFDDSLPVHDQVKDFGENLNAAVTGLEVAERNQATLESGLAELTEERSGIAAEFPETEPQTIEVIEDAEARLAGLWTDVRDLQNLRMVELTTRPATSSAKKVGVLAAILAGVSAVAALVGFASGHGQLAIGLATAAVVLTVMAASALRGRALAGTNAQSVSSDGRPAASNTTGSPITELEQRIEQAAQTLGLAATPSSADLEAVRARLGQERSRRGAWDGVRERLRDVEARSAKEHSKAERAAAETTRLRSARDSVDAEWGEWLGGHDLPKVTPAGALELLGAIAEARAADSEAVSARTALAEIERTAVEWDEAAGQALAAAGRSASDLDRQALRAALDTLNAELQRRKDVVREIDRLHRGIVARLRGNSDGEPALQELGTGDPALWEDEEHNLTQEVEELARQRDEAIEARTRARQLRETIEESADIPRLQAERESLNAQLTAKVHEYQVVVTAEGLISSTLQTFVRERQPKALARASESFAQITGGRFSRVEQDEVAGKESIVVVQCDARLTPDRLSRGTAEQLYLAIRLALVAEFAERSEPLPLIMDDCLVNFDSRRAQQMARLLASSSRDGQCLLFTCHPETKELVLAQSDGAAKVITMTAVT
jgi:uncharacterized protein YhaN